MRIYALFALYYGSVIYSLVNPFYGLLFFIHILLFRPENLTWGDAAFGRLHMTAYTATFISYFFHRRTYDFGVGEGYQKGNVRLFLYFILWLVVVSLLAESSVQESFDTTTELMKVFALCFLFCRLVTTEKQLFLYIWVTSISLGLLAFWGVLQGLAGNDRLEELGGNGGSNVLAAILVLMAPFVLANVLEITLPRRSRLVFLICALTIILCCIYTASRGGFLGLVAGLFTLVIRIKQRTRVLLTCAFLLILLIPWIPKTYIDRIGGMNQKIEEQDTSSRSRPVLWLIALRIWQDYPIAGVGLNNFSPVKELYADKVSDIVQSKDLEMLIFNQRRVPHGLYPCLMAETGLIGTGLFLSLLLRNIFCRIPVKANEMASQYSLYWQGKGAQAGLVGFAIASIFGDFYYIELLYLQLFFVGAVRENTARSSELNKREGICRSHAG